MKKCIIYGNCQKGLLQYYLTKSDFSKYYQIIYTYPVQCKNKENLNQDILSAIDLIIYQNVSDTFGYEFSSEYILSHLKPTCEKILFPSLYFNTYWPQHISQPVIRRLSDIGTSGGGLFPYGDSNIIRLLKSGESLENIIKILSDDSFYSESDVMQIVNASYNELKKRENEQNVDIKVSDYIYNNFRHNYLMHTINHPSCFVGVYVVKKILDILQIHYKNFENNFSTNKHRLLTLTNNVCETPIYPSVIHCLKLPFIDKNYRFNFYYGNKLIFERYIDYYYKYSIGMDIIENKNQDIDCIFDHNIKLIDCPAKQKYFNNIKKHIVNS